LGENAKILTMEKNYLPHKIEAKWQKKWSEAGIHQVQNSSNKPKKYILDMFPYPSGEGLHVGHFKLYTSSDIISRYFRSKGFNVLHPMGWDAFGLPAENYAIKTGTHPAVRTAKNIENIKKQMQIVGLSYDWEREINTTDPKYYKWTQWIFIKLFENGLAYEDEVPINWCPKDKTGLANEEVVGGLCDRCGTKVERKTIRQWILGITKYADRLLEDLEGLDWPESIKDMQINWIGRSEGSLIEFDVENKDYEIVTYTTRIDTVYGVTALVLAPEHPKIEDLTTSKQKEAIKKYIQETKAKSDLERTELNKNKSGVFTGSYAINPLNGEKVPIWVADYVLGFYGTGAVMFVPAHDERDFEFAQKFSIPIKQVIKAQEAVRGPASSVSRRTSSDHSPAGVRQDLSELSPLTEAIVEYGVLINSGEFNGLSSHEAKKAITEYLKDIKKGDFQVNYKLRDWVFSRQRYWGEPIPLIHCPKCGTVPVPEDQLPLTLPEVAKYEPTGTGESPLATIDEWVNTTCPKCQGQAKRETNTMPQWAGSCWYYLRFCDPHNDKELISKDIEKYWMPVDWYLGGAEHAVLHLLYARFWHKFLYDIGLVTTKEPFIKLSGIGLVLAADGRKMSKSWGNVVTPDDVVARFGADTLRIYEAFMGPFGNTIAWNPRSMSGVNRFLHRVYQFVSSTQVKEEGTQMENKAINQTIKKISEDIENLSLNTSVAALMELSNLLIKQNSVSKDNLKKFLVLLCPFAPHLAEELWSLIGEDFSVNQQSWPEFDSGQLQENEFSLVIQVNGKVRDQILIQSDILSNKDLIEKRALASEKVKKFLGQNSVKRSIYIPGKLINLVFSNESK
jgi:leucyl-tRNA synthetase